MSKKLLLWGGGLLGGGLLVKAVFFPSKASASTGASGSSTTQHSTAPSRSNPDLDPEDIPFAKRWWVDIPPPFNAQYIKFFSSAPTEEIYTQQVRTVKTLLAALQEASVGIGHIQNAYRDPDENKRVGGDENSFHMRGKAVDFHTNPTLDQLGEAGMEQLGKILNRHGLKVIFYPFKRNDHATHIQLSDAARTSRRISYEAASGNGYPSTYNEARTS